MIRWLWQLLCPHRAYTPYLRYIEDAAFTVVRARCARCGKPLDRPGAAWLDD